MFLEEKTPAADMGTPFTILEKDGILGLCDEE